MTDRQLHYLKLLRDRHLERLRALLSTRQTLSLEVCRLAHRVWVIMIKTAVASGSPGLSALRFE